MTIRYEIVSGELPAGLSLQETTGRILGDIDFSNLDLGPVWIGPPSGNIGGGDSGEAVIFSELEAESPRQRWFNLTQGTLPPGLVLDSNTGEISGTIGVIPISSDFQEQLNLSSPLWTTPPGRLGPTVTTLSPVNLTIAATPRFGRTLRSYHVESGFLPLGLVLDANTGGITGTIAPLKNPGFTIMVPPLPEPVWVTAGGVIQTVDEGDPFDFTLETTLAPGRTIFQYRVVGGWLPWGLVLDKVTGRIQGNIAELRTGAPPLYLASEDPVWNTPSGNLATGGLGDEIDVEITATPFGSRSISRYSIISGFLPLGLILNAASGEITGSIANIPTKVQPGQYSFTVRVFDSVRNFADRSFSITVQ